MSKKKNINNCIFRAQEGAVRKTGNNGEVGEAECSAEGGMEQSGKPTLASEEGTRLDGHR